MSDLQNQTPANTYKGLLQVGDYLNGVDGTAKYVSDGEGTPSALSVSTTKVGVGTASPQASLHISDGTPAIRLTDTTPATDTVSQVWADTDAVGGLLLAADITDVGTDPFISARIGGTGEASEKMRIDSDGRVGIGTTDPDFKLTVDNGIGNEGLKVIAGNNGDASESVLEAWNNKLNGSSPELLFKVRGDGNVGVGVTNPSSALEVQSNSDEAILKGMSPNGLSNVFIKKTNAGDTEFSNAFVSGGTAGDFIFSNGNVGIGTVSPSAPLEVASTTGGVIMPRMNNSQRNAISSPTDGEMIFNNETNKLNVYNGTAWRELTDTAV